MSTAKFAIVGGGFRANFFLRIARSLPELFICAGMVVRRAEQGQGFKERWGVPFYPDLDALLAAGRPDFVILSVSKSAAPGLIAEITKAGLPIITETPPALTLDLLLELTDLVRKGARIQVAEQYPVQPLNAARIALARSGLLGTVTEAQLALTHEYHAMGLMRRMLDVGFEPARITARDFRAKVMRQPGRGGPPSEPAIDDETQVFAYLDFPGKLGVYEFTSAQPRSWVRAGRVLLRGERGELNDSELRYMSDFRTSVRLDLQRIDTGQNGSPEPYYHRGFMAGERWLYENPYPNVSMGDDDIAGAVLMEKMAEYSGGKGAGPYPFAEGAQDQYLTLCIEQALASGEPVTSTVQPWADLPRG